MLGAFENIIRLGRNYGIGATLISQRPQSVNKEVLSQVECLCVLQVNGMHERKALEDWVQEAGADRKLVGELPGLSQGEGFVWSPSWLRVFDRVQFGKKVTFDASATPEVGKKAHSATLSVVDVEALRADLQEVIARAEKDDPKALRKRINELEQQLRQQPATAAPMVPDPESLRKIVLYELEAIGRKLSTELHGLVGSAERAFEPLQAIAETLRDPGQWARKRIELSSDTVTSEVRLVPAPLPQRNAPPRPSLPSQPMRSERPKAETPAPDGLGKAQLRILSRLAELECATGTPVISRAQLAAWSEYSPTGGGFNNYLGQLRSAGLIEYPGNGNVSLTETGRSIADPEETPTTNAAMLIRAEKVLGGSEAKLLRQVAGTWPENISKEELAQATGFSVNGGGFNNYLGHMRTLGFVDYPQRGMVRASDWLFIQ